MRQLPPLGKRLLLELAAAVAWRDEKVMPLPWGSVLCSLVCSWRPWLINVTVLGFNGESAGVVCAPTCICRHVQDTIPGHLWSSRGQELLWWGEEWEPSDGDSTHAVGSPSQPAAWGEELLSANHWSCCSLTSRNQGLGKTQGKDSSCGAALEEEPGRAAVHMAEAVVAELLCSITEAKRRRNFSLWEAWHTLALCRGKGQQSLGHVCQPGPTGDP